MLHGLTKKIMVSSQTNYNHNFHDLVDIKIFKDPFIIVLSHKARNHNTQTNTMKQHMHNLRMPIDHSQDPFCFSSSLGHQLFN